MVKNLAKIGALVVVLIAVIAFTLNLKGGIDTPDENNLNTGTVSITLQDNIIEGEHVIYRFHSVGMNGIEDLLGEKNADSNGLTKIELETGGTTNNLMITRIKSGNKKRQTISVDQPNLTVDFRR